MTPFKIPLNRTLLTPLICLVLGSTPALAQDAQMGIMVPGSGISEQEFEYMKAYQPVMEFVPFVFMLQEQIRLKKLKLNTQNKKKLILILETLAATKNLTIKAATAMKKQIESDVLTAQQLVQIDMATLKKQNAIAKTSQAQTTPGSSASPIQAPAQRLKPGDAFSPFQTPENLKQLKQFIKELKQN